MGLSGAKSFREVDTSASPGKGKRPQSVADDEGASRVGEGSSLELPAASSAEENDDSRGSRATLLSLRRSMATPTEQRPPASVVVAPRQQDGCFSFPGKNRLEGTGGHIS